jgi:CRP-like cAMP-binding protein
MLTQTQNSFIASVHPASVDKRFSVPGSMSLFGELELTGAPITYERNSEIFGEGEPAEYVYQVVRGAVRSYRVLSDGRRQINAFHLPGDVFGLEPGEDHHCSAEAISDAVVLVVRRSLVLKYAARNAEVGRQLWSLTAGQLSRAQNHALLLIKSAQERVAAFLLEMAERLVAKGTVELPMSRQDIADYLGLTIETVSRTLTQLAGNATIQLLASRRIVLRNRSVLDALNG